MDQIISLIKRATITILIVGAILLIGTAVNIYIPWLWLTYFFVIIQHLLNLFGWLYDMPTLINLVGWSYVILGFYWIFRASMAFIKLFEKPQ